MGLKQHQPIHHTHSHPHSLARSMLNSSTTTAAASSSSASTPDRPSRRRPIPRKGHTKSRAGCPNCKRRKVKCDEASPECGPCRRLGLICEYCYSSSSSRRSCSATAAEAAAGSKTTGPVMAPVPAPARLPSAAVVPTYSSGGGGRFDMADLRFFQHFLLCAYPPLPIGGWSVWQLVSQMSHEYEFLVHAMLGLGASHLSLLVPSPSPSSSSSSSRSHVQDALRHRVAAIKLLNEFLARGPHATADIDAAFAAILSLTYQAAHMPDGLYDFLTMTRGCTCSPTAADAATVP
ncbi:hypothetical protein JDV02_004579 [Purpureocillium takamizusanense]|uniref:Zn(2)-C6 fungal-type domain-containing protein n=1 Tax=Purpureocillium takamizusanense TaxID=2060973 RepID=A0A9Q8V9J5_9HYPO|nr:uncharacterized protein JDV02_004579 [Purpureocillium takamizusanense]UNI18305.1 hypothetical protein JDV02_004579 [Purpureocillium takamizusanense]